jgi:hypothetical protein
MQILISARFFHGMFFPAIAGQCYWLYLFAQAALISPHFSRFDRSRSQRAKANRAFQTGPNA